MSKTSTLNAILIGLIIVLVGVILVQDSRNNVACARDDGNASARGGANGIIAVTGQYSDRNSVLYLVDTTREVILTYACYPKAGGFRRSNLTFLNGRLYTWDAIYSQKAGFFGESEGPTPQKVRERIKEKTEE